MRPLVTVIIPCYNAMPWVGAAIDSALSQSWDSIEIIAVNDGSTDGSLAVLEGRAGAKVRVINQTNKGAAAARNAGLAAARGDFIQFLDADDLLAPNKVSAQMEVLLSAKPGKIASARWARFGLDPSAAVQADTVLLRDLSPVEILLLHTSGGHMMHPAAWLVPSAVAAAAGPWNESLSLNDDGEYFSRVVLASQGIVYAPESLSLYRSQLAQSLSGRRDRRSLESLYLSCELVAEHLGNAEGTPRVRQALADYYQRLSFELYPDAPDLHRRAEKRAAELGGSAVRPQQGPRMALLASAIGWRLAKRICRLIP